MHTRRKPLRTILGRAALAVGCLAMLTATSSPLHACGYGAFNKVMLHHWAGQAISEDAKVAENAQRRLRRAGQPGLNALFEVHANLLNPTEVLTPLVSVSQAVAPPVKPVGNPIAEKNRLLRAINTVAGQFDAHASQLYWYTDFARAQDAAIVQNKPMISLHMLGKLTDECSCANSRFFRTILYANTDVAKHLRENFILHWHSVRPVPTVTIDFGDGRVLTRTLTGNSIHYVVAADGTPIEAIPGLYGPGAFMKQLQQAQELHASYTKLPKEERAQFLQAWHQQRGDEVVRQWNADLAAVGGVSLVGTPAIPGQFRNDSPNGSTLVNATNSTLKNAARKRNFQPKRVPANVAAVVAVGKGKIEMPILVQIGLAQRDALATQTSDEFWQKIAQRHMADANIDAGSRRLMKEHIPAEVAMPLAVTKYIVETPLMRMVRNLQNSAAVDTVQNEYLRHTELHRWFAAGQTQDLAALNDQVYAEIFLTPKTDPWLGLVPPDSYSALVNNGLKVETPE